MHPTKNEGIRSHRQREVHVRILVSHNAEQLFFSHGLEGRDVGYTRMLMIVAVLYTHFGGRTPNPLVPSVAIHVATSEPVDRLVMLIYHLGRDANHWYGSILSCDSVPAWCNHVRRIRHTDCGVQGIPPRTDNQTDRCDCKGSDTCITET